MAEDMRTRYKGICPVCGAELWICPSIAMLEGWHNGGHGSCYNCKTFLHLVFDAEKMEFQVQEFEKYMAEERKKYPRKEETE